MQLLDTWRLDLCKTDAAQALHNWLSAASGMLALRVALPLCAASHRSSFSSALSLSRFLFLGPCARLYRVLSLLLSFFPLSVYHQVPEGEDRVSVERWSPDQGICDATPGADDTEPPCYDVRPFLATWQILSPTLAGTFQPPRWDSPLLSHLSASRQALPVPVASSSSGTRRSPISRRPTLNSTFLRASGAFSLPPPSSVTVRELAISSSFPLSLFFS